MSLKKNAIANYAGQGYTALIGIIVMPMFLKFLGAEAFGLVGFFVVLQAWLYLLDMGLSPTLARQVAYLKDLDQGLDQFGKLLRSFEILFVFLAVSVAFAILVASDGIAHHWIDNQILPKDTIASCIALMGITIALRLFSSLYRSGIGGLEDQVWLNAATILIISARFIGALGIMRFVTSDIVVFFQLQTAVGFVEVIVLASRFYRKLALNPLRLAMRIDWPSLRGVAPFAMSIAYTAGIWVVISQSDKLILSGVLPLDKFGYFSLVSLIAGGVLVTTGPITQAILPRMTSLLAARRQDEMLRVYRNASQLAAVIAISTALVVGFFSEALIYAWTGDRAAANWGATVLPWFALGNGVLALGAFQYYLQYSFGQLKLHVIGSTISALIQVPIIYYAATRYGATGAGIAWLAIRSVWFFIWTPIVHRRLVPGLHIEWLVKDLMPVITVAALAIAVLVKSVSIDLTINRGAIAVLLMLLGLVEISAVSASSKYVRSSVLRYFTKRNVVS